MSCCSRPIRPNSVGMVRAATEVGLKTQLFGGAMVGMQYASLITQLSEKLNRVVNYHFFVPSPKMNFPGIEEFLKKYQSHAKDAGVDPLGFYQPPFAYAAMQVLRAGHQGDRKPQRRQARRLHPRQRVQHDRRATSGSTSSANGRMRASIDGAVSKHPGHGLEQYMTGHKQVIVYPAEYKDGELDSRSPSERTRRAVAVEEASSMQITAAVAREKFGRVQHRASRADGSASDELLVKIVASGMCQTDQHGRDGYYNTPLPAVFGHEGAGVVIAVGKRRDQIRARRSRGHVVSRGAAPARIAGARWRGIVRRTSTSRCAARARTARR